MKTNKRTKTKTYNLLAIFYFFLIFGIVIYLFMTLFNKSSEGQTIDTEMDIFNGSSDIHKDGPGHSIIMRFPKFAVKKR